MIYLAKTTNFFNARRCLLCGLLFMACLASLPIAAQAQCTSWDASGKTNVIQRGQLNLIKLDLQQKGRALTGTASNIAVVGGNFGYDTTQDINGTVDGTIDGDSFSVQIFWKGGLTGVYNGKILPSGRLDGETFDKNNSKIRQTWQSEGVLPCAPPPVSPVVSQPTIPRPKPIKTSGKARPAEPVAPKLEPPYIVASLARPQYLGAATGLAVLTWDGGPDHPYAEVWVKVNGADETFMVEQAKGSRQVTAELGKAYLYILTDAGKTLATVAVVLAPR